MGKWMCGLWASWSMKWPKGNPHSWNSHPWMSVSLAVVLCCSWTSNLICFCVHFRPCWWSQPLGCHHSKRYNKTNGRMKCTSFWACVWHQIQQRDLMLPHCCLYALQPSHHHTITIALYHHTITLPYQHTRIPHTPSYHHPSTSITSLLTTPSLQSHVFCLWPILLWTAPILETCMLGTWVWNGCATGCPNQETKWWVSLLVDKLHAITVNNQPQNTCKCCKSKVVGKKKKSVLPEHLIVFACWMNFARQRQLVPPTNNQLKFPPFLFLFFLGVKRYAILGNTC